MKKVLWMIFMTFMVLNVLACGCVVSRRRIDEWSKRDSRTAEETRLCCSGCKLPFTSQGKNRRMPG